LILGQKEALEEAIIIRDMKTGRQETVKLDKVVKEMEKYLKK
jgi:histidyl-tRNA synthetase